MNLPNKLTLMRVILIPFFLVMIYVDAIPLHFLWALVIFAAASLTDMLDGKIARARGLVTNFGKFLDPLADKVLVITALTVFVELTFRWSSSLPESLWSPVCGCWLRKRALSSPPASGAS